MTVSKSGKDPLNAELAALRREVEDLKRQMRQVPSRFPMAVPVGDGASIRETIAQANSFSAGHVVYNNGGTWALAQANAAASTAKYTGVVESADGSSFVVVYAGRIALSLSAGVTYYLSDTVAGALTTRASISAYELTIPVLRAVSASAAIVMPARDIGSDLTTLTAGDATNGGGKLVVNIGNAASNFYLTADETDGVIISTDEDHAVQMHADGSISIDQTGMTMTITDGVVVIDYGSGNTITFDPANMVGDDGDVRLREIGICDDTGAEKKILVLCSDFYDP